MPRLLHLADVHLDARFGGFGREADARRREVLDAFRELPVTAREHGAEAVLIAGDLFDRPRPSEATVIAVRETVRRLQDDGIPVAAVPGNHDAVALNAALYEDALAGAAAFTSPRFGPPATLRCGDVPVHVYGFAYDAAEEPDPLSTFEKAEAPGFHVVLLHGAVPGAPHWEGGSALRLPLERLAALEADYLALGDYHRFRPPSEFGDGLPACYPGSFAAVDLSEVGPKGPVLVALEEGVPPDVQPLSGGARPVVRADPIDVTSFQSESEIAEAIGERVTEIGFPVVRLEGEPTFPFEADDVRARLEERFGCAAVEDATRFFDEARLSEIAAENTVAGHVARLGLEAAASATSEEGREAAEQGLKIALRVMEVE